MYNWLDFHDLTKAALISTPSLLQLFHYQHNYLERISTDFIITVGIQSLLNKSLDFEQFVQTLCACLGQ